MSLIQRVLATLHPCLPKPERRPPAALAARVLALSLVATGSAWGAVDNVQVTPSFFSPNADGYRDSVQIRWSATTPPEELRILLIRRIPTSAVGDTVRIVSLIDRPAGPDVFTWDGRNSTGAVSPDGNYLVSLEQRTASGSPVDTAGNVAGFVLDTTPPPAPSFETYWADLDTTAGLVRIEGNAPRADSVRIFLGGQPIDTVRVVAADSSFVVDVPLRVGANSLALESFDFAGNPSVLTPAITITYRNTSDVVFVLARPFFFSPNGDGVLDFVTVQVRLDAPTTRLLVQVRPANPPLFGSVVDSLNWIRTLNDAPADSGDHFFPWDGRDSSGSIMADGTWYVTARAESATVAGLPVAPDRFRLITVEIDNTAPAVPIPVPPPPAATTRSFYVFTGRLTRTTEAVDTVLVWRGGAVVGRDPDEQWSVQVPLTLGDNTFQLQAVDPAGNRSALGAPITIVYSEPLGFHAPERFRATDVFDVNVSRTARSVRIDVHDLDGRRVRTLLVQQPGQRYELPWDLRDDRGITVGDGPYVARVTVTYDDGVVETRSGAIVAAK